MLCADCVYVPLYGESWRALAACLVALCSLHLKTRVLVSVQRRNNDGVDLFLAQLAVELQVERVRALELKGAKVEIYRCGHRGAGEAGGG